MHDASSSHSTLVALSPHLTLDKNLLGLVLNKKGLEVVWFLKKSMIRFLTFSPVKFLDVRLIALISGFDLLCIFVWKGGGLARRG
jgi:hypothetical protein